MRRYRCLVPPERILHQQAFLSQEESHYLKNVLRIGIGESLEIFDGKGRIYHGRVRLWEPVGEIEILSEGISTADSPLPLLLATALTKGISFEWVLQKGTELGVTGFLPLLTRHCEIKAKHQEVWQHKKLRWERILQSAARQSRRTIVPQLYNRIGLEKMILELKGPPADGRISAGSYDWSSFPREINLALIEKNGQSIQSLAAGGIPSGVLVVIGPEGGWDSEEAAQLQEVCIPITLGPRILRAETAAIAATTLVQALWGDLHSCC